MLSEGKERVEEDAQISEKGPEKEKMSRASHRRGSKRSQFLLGTSDAQGRAFPLIMLY